MKKAIANVNVQKGRIIAQTNRRQKKEQEQSERQVECEREQEKAALRSYEQKRKQL